MMEGGRVCSDHIDRDAVPVQIELLHRSPEVSKLFAFCCSSKLILDAAQAAFILSRLLCVC